MLVVCTDRDANQQPVNRQAHNLAKRQTDGHTKHNTDKEPNGHAKRKTYTRPDRNTYTHPDGRTKRETFKEPNEHAKRKPYTRPDRKAKPISFNGVAHVATSRRPFTNANAAANARKYALPSPQRP